MSKTPTSKTKVLLDGLKFPEGPRWHEGRLWFSDMGEFKVIAVDLEGNSEVIVQTRYSPSGLGWLPDDTLLVVSMQDRRLLKLESDKLSEVADISHLASFYCNDMVVDKQGRAYIGNFGFDYANGKPFAPAEVILVTPDGNSRVVADEISFPNGCVITPDDQTLIVAETFATRLTAFDIQPDGTLENRRIWANLKSYAPDGICLDEEGAIWVATPGRGRVIRVQEGGKILDQIKVQTDAYACMLGGPERRTLFIATSDNTRVNGHIEIVEVEVPGAGLP